MTEHNKATVRRLVEEVFNGGHLEVIDELYAPELARAAKRWIAPFRASFPDVHMEIGELIAEGDKVVGRFTCSATHQGAWLGEAPRGVGSSGSMRSGSSGSATAGSCTSGRLRTPCRGCASLGSPRRRADPDDPAGSGPGVPSTLATGHVVGNQELGRPGPLVVDEQRDQLIAPLGGLQAGWSRHLPAQDESRAEPSQRQGEGQGQPQPSPRPRPVRRWRGDQLGIPCGRGQGNGGGRIRLVGLEQRPQRLPQRSIHVGWLVGLAAGRLRLGVRVCASQSARLRTAIWYALTVLA